MTYELIFAVVVIGCVLSIAVAIVYAVVLDHEEAKREAEQQKFYAVIHRTPTRMHEKAAQGFTRPPEIKR